MFKLLLRQLLQGKALSVEDTVDVLTLKDNKDRNEDFTIALHLLAHVKVSVEMFLSIAMLTIFRHCLRLDDYRLADPSGAVFTSMTSA